MIKNLILSPLKKLNKCLLFCIIFYICLIFINQILTKIIYPSSVNIYSFLANMINCVPILIFIGCAIIIYIYKNKKWGYYGIFFTNFFIFPSGNFLDYFDIIGLLIQFLIFSFSIIIIFIILFGHEKQEKSNETERQKAGWNVVKILIRNIEAASLTIFCILIWANSGFFNGIILLRRGQYKNFYFQTFWDFCKMLAPVILITILIITIITIKKYVANNKYKQSLTAFFSIIILLLLILQIIILGVVLTRPF